MLGNPHFICNIETGENVIYLLQPNKSLVRINEVSQMSCCNNGTVAAISIIVIEVRTLLSVHLKAFHYTSCSLTHLDKCVPTNNLYILPVFNFCVVL